MNAPSARDQQSGVGSGAERKQRFSRFVGVLFALSIATAGFGQTTAAPGPVDPVHGFPWWYQDANSSTRLEPCLDTHSGACVVLAQPGFDPNKVVSYPGNFPSEWFYYVVDSDKVTTPGCPASGIPAGLAKYRAAVEGTFVNGTVQPGQQITFGRTKIVASGLCPNTAYTFRHPYGTDTITTDSDGQVVANKKGGTIDVGCGAAPCNFPDTNQSRVLTAFLRSNAKPPAGYLGDAVTLSSVTGSPVNQNFFSVSGQNVNVSTDKFTVSGRIAGPVMVSPYAADFGVEPQRATVSKTLTVTNISTGSVSLSFSKSGANPNDFSPASPSGCPSSLAKGANCTLNLNFTPTKTSGESAQMQLGRAVDLAGTGSVANSSFSLSPSPNIDFGLMRVRGTSTAQTITVANTSTTAPLQVTSAALSPADQFGIASDACTGRLVSPQQTCSIGVTFNPTVMGTPTTMASLTVTASGAPVPQSVSLSGTPTGGVSNWSNGSLTAYGFPNWYQDENPMKLKPCLDINDATCVLLPDPNFNPALPLHFDSTNTGINFPSEAFYIVADSDKLTTPGCPASVVDGVSYPAVSPGRAKYRAAIEQAFLNGPPKWGEQITFGRTKIVADGLCPMTAYYFTHPYGRDLITTNNLGQVVANKKGGTVDVGCGAANCDFSVALGSRVFGGFLQWDSGAPAGHLGDGNVGTLHTISGSPFKDSSGNPANYFQISDASGNQVPGAFTNLFTVAGAIAQ